MIDAQKKSWKEGASGLGAAPVGVLSFHWAKVALIVGLVVVGLFVSQTNDSKNTNLKEVEPAPVAQPQVVAPKPVKPPVKISAHAINSAVELVVQQSSTPESHPTYIKQQTVEELNEELEKLNAQLIKDLK